MRTALIGALLAAAVLIVYGQAAGFDFVNIDDPGYVQNNEHVRAGLTRAGILWAFTATDQANWHPLTWISLMLDATVGGAGPRVFHLTNVALHLLSAWLLFLVLGRMTRAPWRSALVAALFAVHPLHVESVAWIAERKDVLSALFWFLTIFAWLRYTERPGTARYVAVAGVFAMGLLSKPMLVTLPLVLLLLDYWPLARFGRSPGAGSRPVRLFTEKLPLLALSLASSVITLVAQKKGGAVRTLDQFPPGERVANAVVSCVEYIRKAVWPRDLGVYYAHPRNTLPVIWIAACAVVLLGVSSYAILVARRRPHIAVGWFWYLVALVPVIGLVQVGRQAMADRYTYVPLVGLFIAAVWSVPGPRRGKGDAGGERAQQSGEGLRVRRVDGEHMVRRPASRGMPAEEKPPAGKDQRPVRSVRGAAVPAVVAAAVLVTLMACAHRQAGFWRDSVTLLRHSLEITPDDAFGQNNLGSALQETGRTEEAVAHWNEAVRLDPGYADAHANLAGGLLVEGRTDEAAGSCRRALSLEPEHPGAHTNLGIALMRQGKMDEASAHFAESVRLRPNHAATRNDLGIALFQTHRTDEAVAQFQEALRLDPNFAGAHVGLAIIQASRSLFPEAVAHLGEALRIDPQNETARRLLARLKAPTKESIPRQ